MTSVRLYTKQDDRIESEVDKYVEQLKHVAKHQKIAGTLAVEEVVTHKKSIDVNGQVQTIEDQELVPLYFPKAETIAECKRTRDVMKVFATPFKGYLLKELAAKDSPDYIVPIPITLFLCYWRRLRNLNLPILNDSGNKMKEGLEAIEKMLTEKFWREVNSNQTEAQIVAHCEALFEQGANINRWVGGSSPLAIAAQRHFNDLLIKLLEWGTDIDCQLDALMCAIKNNNQAGIRILLEKIHSQRQLDSKDVKNIFAHVINENKLSILKEFTKYLPTDFENQKKLIDDALSSGTIDIAIYLLEFFKLNYLENPKTNNPVDWFQRPERQQYLQSLITIYGSDNITKLCPTLAHQMCSMGGDMFSVLVEAKADLNITRESDGMTPLMVAAAIRATDIMKTILDTKKIEINQQDRRGYTALMHTIAENDFRRNKETVHLLLEHHANPDIEVFSLQEEQKSVQKLNKNIKNAFMLEFNKPWPQPYQEAIYRGRMGYRYVERYETYHTDGLSLDLLKILYEKMDKKFVEKLFWELLEEGNCDKLKVFIHLWGSEKLTTLRNDKNETPLIAALRLNHVNYADALIKQGNISVNAPIGQDSLFAHSALTHFARAQNEAACWFLLQNGADPEVRDADGKTQAFLDRFKPPASDERVQCRIL